MVTGLFAGQHNTKLHGTITGVILKAKHTSNCSSFWDNQTTVDTATALEPSIYM